MRSMFYIAAYGEQSAIGTLQKDIGLVGAEIKPLKTSLAAGEGVQWIWRSPRHECLTVFPEDEVTAFLAVNEELLGNLAAHRHSIQDLVVMVVCYLEQGESPRGYSLSSDLIGLLARAKASMEIDIEQFVVPE